MKKTKIFAAYLPQYHETEDNNKFWGKGYTDWVAVKNSTPQFEGHIQPQIPLDNNFYDLSNVDTIRGQAKIAKEYGISGFNIYHYWFKNGKKELEKPAELLYAHQDIDIEYFFTWDPGSWKRTWSNVPGNDWAPAFDKAEISKSAEPVLLVEGGYEGETAWKKHFDYLLPFFNDRRYLKISNKPVFFLMDTGSFDVLGMMANYWDILAKDAGFDGMFMASRSRTFFNKSAFNRSFRYEPEYSAWGKRRTLETRFTKFTGIEIKNKCPVRYIYNYDLVWKSIIAEERKKNTDIPGCFVSYDDTPRRGKKAMIVSGGTPDKFFKYFGELYSLCCNNDRDILLITAWNEWGEGAYLEPDERDGYAYLEALKKAIQAYL